MASITEQTSECPTLSYHALYRLPTGYASEVWQVPWRVRIYTHHTETTCIWWILMPSHPLKKWIVTDKTICIWNEQVCVLSSISVFRMADGSLTYTLKVLTWPVTFALCLFRFQDIQHYTNNSQKTDILHQCKENETGWDPTQNKPSASRFATSERKIKDLTS